MTKDEEVHSSKKTPDASANCCEYREGDALMEWRFRRKNDHNTRYVVVKGERPGGARADQQRR